MSPEDQKRMVNAFRIVNVQKLYKETYGNDWRTVYEEDKQNGCLMKEE